MAKYIKPDFATKHIFNPLFSFLMKSGLSFRGSHILLREGSQVRQGVQHAREPAAVQRQALPGRPARRDRLGEEHPRLAGEASCGSAASASRSASRRSPATRRCRCCART